VHDVLAGQRLESPGNLPDNDASAASGGVSPVSHHRM
jgi:hypothetical protein